MPYLVTGSNGDVAWAFTNAQVDETDVIELETDPARPGRYRTPAGWKEFTVRSEEIPIAGGPSRRIVFTNTIWGPVVDLGIRMGGSGFRDGFTRNLMPGRSAIPRFFGPPMSPRRSRWRRGIDPRPKLRDGRSCG